MDKDSEKSPFKKMYSLKKITYFKEPVLSIKIQAVTA